MKNLARRQEKIFNNLTFRVKIEYQVNTALRMKKEAEYFLLEGFENSINIINFYHLKNVGIKKITIYLENGEIIHTNTYSGNYEYSIRVKKLIFSDIVNIKF